MHKKKKRFSIINMLNLLNQNTTFQAYLKSLKHKYVSVIKMGHYSKFPGPIELMEIFCF
jgi:hypothetical protein